MTDTRRKAASGDLLAGYLVRARCRVDVRPSYPGARLVCSCPGLARSGQEDPPTGVGRRRPVAPEHTPAW